MVDAVGKDHIMSISQCGEHTEVRQKTGGKKHGRIALGKSGAGGCQRSKDPQAATDQL